MNKIIFLLAILCTTFTYIKAQSITPEKIEVESLIVKKVKVEGRVIDKVTKVNINEATVSFFQYNKLIKEVETDMDGFYSLHLNPDNYNITVSYIGYNGLLQKRTEIKPDINNRFDFAMQEGIYMDISYCTDVSVPLSSLNRGIVSKRDIKELALSSSSIELNRYSVITSRNSTPFKKYSNRIIKKFVTPFRSPISNIPLYVDRTSFDYVQLLIQSENHLQKEVVRVEEMINYFNYDYPIPTVKTRPLAVFTELIKCPWNENNKLLHIGLQGRKIDTDKLPPSNLVFLIDISGSMSSLKKLPYIKEAFKTLVDNLSPKDKVAIVTYSHGSLIALKSTSGSNKQDIMKAIDNLNPSVTIDLSNTNGIGRVYEIAHNNFITDGNNRVIIMTDGDFSIGPTDNDDMLQFIEKKKNSGVFLSVLGFGNQEFQESQVKALNKDGKVNLTYIEDLAGTKKALLKEMGSDLNTIAKDVKVQLEFNPAYVGKYKLIGYETRKMVPSESPEESDGLGELNPGHQVTFLYEIEPPRDRFELVDEKLTYQKRSNNLLDNREIGRLNVSYKAPSSLKTWEFITAIRNQTIPSEEVTDLTKHAAAIAELGLLLQDSKHKANASYSNVKSILQTLDKDKYMTDDVLKLLNQSINIAEVK